MSHDEIFEEIGRELRDGKTVVEATVIQTKGSTPREAGSRMLVKADGSLSGTIGGGCGEAGVIQKARLSLLDGQIREDLADLTEDITTESEGVCGGTYGCSSIPGCPRGRTSPSPSGSGGWRPGPRILSYTRSSARRRRPRASKADS